MPPVVGLVAHQDYRSLLIQELGRSGVSVAPMTFEADKIDGLLIDGSSLKGQLPEGTPDLIETIRQPEKVLSALLIKPHETIEQPDLLTLTPSVPAFVQQLKLHMRQKDVANEAALRMQTLAALKADPLSDTETDANEKTLLYFGEPGSFYLKMKALMTELGYRVSAALSERTAFESFRSFIPSAFVVAVTERSYPFELLDHIHGRPDLKNMPVVAVTGIEDRLPDNLENINGLVRIGADFSKASKAIRLLIDKTRVPNPVPPKRCQSPVRDRFSDCFSDVFAETHVKAQVRFALEHDRPHCVAKLAPMELENREPLNAGNLPVFANLMNSVLRKQDCLARLNWSEFLVSLPSTRADDARDALERARRVVESTTLARGESFSFRFTVTELEPHLNADQYWSVVMREQPAKRNRIQASVA